jgi:hypothetical protein
VGDLGGVTAPGCGDAGLAGQGQAGQTSQGLFPPGASRTADLYPVKRGADQRRVRPERRAGARSPGQPPSLTVTDPCVPGLGGRGTTRGTSTGRVPVQCALSEHPRTVSVQVERLKWPSSHFYSVGSGVRALAPHQQEMSLLHLVSWDGCSVPRNNVRRPSGRDIRSRKVIAAVGTRQRHDDWRE